MSQKTIDAIQKRESAKATPKKTTKKAESESK